MLKHPELNLIQIAAADSSAEAKAAADFVCTGSHDEAVFNHAIELLPRGGNIRMFDGNYFIDAFPNEGNSAIFFGENNGSARVINLFGTTENKGYNTQFGTALHVTEHAFETIPQGSECRVFYGSPVKPPAPGAFYTYTHINNVNFENFQLYFPDASRPITGIDGSCFGSMELKLLGIYTERYFRDRFLHEKPATPQPGCVGVRSVPTSNDEMARIGYDTVNVGGLYLGFQLNRVDHLVMKTCTAARCCYGYDFRGGPKTLTMINCCDEGNTHLPHFSGRGHLTCIDYNIERFNADFIPDDPLDDGRRGATEDTPGEWHGFISFTLQGKAFSLNNFWEKGSGNNIKTVNLDHDRDRRPEFPEYLETFFDRETGKTLTFNGSCWVDAMGNSQP